MDPIQIDHHASYHSPLHPLRVVGVSRSFHAYIRADIGLLASLYWPRALIPMTPTYMDHNAFYRSPLHPLSGICAKLGTSLRRPPHMPRR